MSELDRDQYRKIKADPDKFARYIERKRLERKAKPARETERKRRWRAANRERAMAIRRANHKVELAIRRGELVKPEHCVNCGADGKIEGHHYLGYAPEHWLDVKWLCVACHANEHHIAREGLSRRDEPVA